MQQNYKDPPPYPGHSKQVPGHPSGLRQSLSSSEASADTCPSSSENLAFSQRQEPQGEETQTCHPLDLGGNEGSSYSILERLGMPFAAFENSDKLLGNPVLNKPPVSPSFVKDRSPQNIQSVLNSSSNKMGLPGGSPVFSQGHLTVPHWQLGSKTPHPQDIHPQRQNEARIKVGDQPSPTRPSTEFVLSTSTTLTEDNSSRTGEPACTDTYRHGTVSSSSDTGTSPPVLTSSSSYPYLSPRVAPVSTYHHPHPYVNTHWMVGNEDFKLSSRLSSTPDSSQKSPEFSPLSSHAHSLSHLTHLSPPPEYPGQPRSPHHHPMLPEKYGDIRTCRSYEAVDRMEAASNLTDLRPSVSSQGLCMHDFKFQSSLRSSSSSLDTAGEAAVSIQQPTSARHLLEALAEENRSLREELALAAVRVVKLQKFEMEIQKVHESHEALVRSSQKQESLWSAMRAKLEQRVRQLESTRTGAGTDSENRTRLADKDALISQLLSQNQELTKSRDRLEADKSRLTSSLSEHKARVEVLESALRVAHTRISALNQEVLQAVTTKIPEFGAEDRKSFGTLRNILDDKDAKIHQLKSEVAQVEKKYLKEATLKQLRMEDTNQLPREFHLAALEQNTSDMEKFIDEVKTEKLKHMDELHYSHKKVAELESRIKQLQSNLAEKEAIVKVFQRSPLSLARSSSLHALCHSSLSGPLPARSTQVPLSGWSGTRQTSESPGCRESAAIRHVKTGSTSTLELGRKLSLGDDLFTGGIFSKKKSQSDSEEEKLFTV